MSDTGDVIRLDQVRDIPDMTGLTPVTPNANGSTPGEDSWQPINLGQLAERPPLQPTLGTTGLVYPGERHVFSGPPESAKTIAAYAIGIQIVQAGGTVVVIDLEMGRWQARDRLRDLGCGPDEFSRIQYVDPDTAATPERIDRLVELGPQLVIIDAAAGAYELQGLDDNKRGDVERFARIYVNAFWRNDIATIVLDHVTKNAETRGRFVIGSERKLGGAFVHLGFETITPIRRGTAGLYKISTHKDRGGFLKRGRLADLALISDPETHRISWHLAEVEEHDETDPWKPTKLMQRASEFLQTQPEPVSFNIVITSVKGNDAQLKKGLEHLIAMGYAAEEPGAHGARLVRSLRLYHEGDPPLLPGLPTSASSLPAEDTTSSASSASPYKGAAEAEEEDDQQTSASAKPIDVHDPAVQKLLDDPDPDIPF